MWRTRACCIRLRMYRAENEHFVTPNTSGSGAANVLRRCESSSWLLASPAVCDNDGNAQCVACGELRRLSRNLPWWIGLLSELVITSAPSLPFVLLPTLVIPQSPIEVPGVSNVDFLRLSFNAKRAARGEPEMEPLEVCACQGAGRVGLCACMSVAACVGVRKGGSGWSAE